ncbi:MAG: hypothetical protein KU37_06700 [Sulfuricurvum sp. PC08-66]|nr:MAG: hypothetical protein KU37_06700 [Sulfuricurvum sp. PC08-66]
MAHLQHKLKLQQEHINTLQAIGTALSAENNLNKLLEMILEEAKRFTNADGGTLYLMSNDERFLHFTVVQTDSLGIKMGGVQGAMTWPPLPLYKTDGTKNQEMVAAMCALSGEAINIPDVYEAEGFNFEGTKKFDAGTGFRSKSMLVIPMKNYENEVIGVCQLINCIDPITRETVPFSAEFEASALSLASQAAVAITNVQLINDLRELLEAFIKSIASAIDAKSPYTGGHVRKVAEIAMLLANEISECDEGPYRDIHYTYDELNQIRIAALMHDVGKITTPEYIMDKSTKLETIYDRIETVKTRFELLKRDKKIALLEAKLALSDASEEDTRFLDEAYANDIAQIDADMAFIKESNIGGEFMSDDKIARIKAIAAQTWHADGQTLPMLSENEVYNLNIRKGTLTEEERQIINYHATMSNTMLEALPFPKKLSRVPAIAGGHHEKLNGKGYPKGLRADELGLEARIMAVADIFEALTASDRPYKEAKKMSETMKILSFMVKDGDIDGELLEFFYKRNLHLKYGINELKPEQLDIE